MHTQPLWAVVSCAAASCGSRAVRYGLLLAIASVMVGAPAQAGDCPDPRKALGVSRVIEIDTSSGAMFGSATKREKEPDFLQPGEVVLTFDDGPMPRVTRPILDALDAFCTKATFFSIGKMALAYPAVMKDVLARGHTVGGHTQTHPNNLRRLSLEKAADEIERGFSALSLAGEAEIAPFFRFPGLNDSDELLDVLQHRGVASFTVDVISNDSYIGSPQAIVDRTIRHTVARGGGILLFHDLKRPTARAIPAILAALKARGFKVVHLVAKTPIVPSDAFDDELKARLTKIQKQSPTGTVAPRLQTADGLPPPVTHLATPPRSRIEDTTVADTVQAGAASR